MTPDPLEYCEKALEAYEVAVSPSGLPFQENLEALSKAVFDMKIALGAADLPWETALAEEVMITLRIVQEPADLESSDVQGDLRQIRRRLME